MLQASRSTVSGNALEAMRPPGIKRSTIFRRRGTCSRVRRLDSRITVTGNNQGKPASLTCDEVSACPLQIAKREHCTKNVKAGNITGGYRPSARARFKEEINGNEAAPAEANVLNNSESKIHLDSRQVLEESESCWEWKVDERPKRSPGMSKLRTLQLERADLFSGLRSGLQKMLQAVREMKSQQLKPH